MLWACAKSPVVQVEEDVPNLEDDIFILGTNPAGIQYGMDVDTIQTLKDGTVTTLVIYILPPPGLKEEDLTITTISGRVNFNCDTKQFFRKSILALDDKNHVLKKHVYDKDNWVSLSNAGSPMLRIAEKLCPNLNMAPPQAPSEDEPTPQQPQQDEQHHKGNPVDGYRYDT